MLRRLQLIVLLLLAISLPVRGYASATMLFCADAHVDHSTQQSAVHQSTTDDHPHHEHAAMHGDVGGADHSGLHTSSGTHGDHSDAKAASGGSCSVCGACCTGVSVGPTLPGLVAIAISSAVVPFTPSIYAGVDLDHAERPPLVFFLA